MSVEGYYLGCPAWGMKSWVGRLFPRGTAQTDFLEHYAQTFNSVEGNTTFYALPKAETVARWNAQTPQSFRFCFKFPRTITHDRMLVHCQRDVAQFIDRISPLEGKLGMLMIQLPPRFGFGELSRLGSFVADLPQGFRYAVELRHRVFFNGHDEEHAAVELLRRKGIDLITMDARGLHASTNPGVAEIQRRKPNNPVVMRATGMHPVVRIVPHDDFEAGREFSRPWIDQVATWIRSGHRPFVFLHAPDDTFAPANAYRFHQLLSEQLQVGSLPDWNCAAAGPQLGLFA